MKCCKKQSATEQNKYMKSTAEKKLYTQDSDPDLLCHLSSDKSKWNRLTLTPTNTGEVKPGKEGGKRFYHMTFFIADFLIFSSLAISMFRS